mgnify:CR=1 FL=1
MYSAISPGYARACAALGACLRSGDWRAVVHAHVVLWAGFAFFVCLLLSVIAKCELRDQLGFGGMMFVGFLASAIVLGWLMYPFPL